MRSNRRGVSSVLVSLALIVFIVVACIAGYVYYKQATFEAGPAEPFYGTCQIKVTACNVFSKADITESSPTYKAYHTLGKTLDSMVKADFAGGTTLTADTATDMDISRDDKGLLALWIYAGTADFLDIPETEDANPRVEEFRTDLDINADGKRDTILSLDVSDLAEPGASIKPVTELSLQLVPDETSNLTINDITTKAMGTGTKTGTIEWQITTFAEKKGWALARVYVTQNRTDEDLVKVTGISIGYNVGTFTGSDITYEPGAKRWAFNIGVAEYRTVQEAKLIKRAIGESSYCSFTVSVETYFESGSPQVTLTLYVDEINPAGSITTDSDAMIISAT